MVTTRHAIIAICLTITYTEVPPAQTVPVGQQTPATRRSQRVQMSSLDVRSPNGQVTFTFLPNAERVTFTVALELRAGGGVLGRFAPAAERASR